MEVQEAPATPTEEFRAIDGNSAIQNRKRRRLSLRRVSFVEQPSIHVFARDFDYETPPEGTMSHLSAPSTPTSVSRSPQRRSERLAAARGGRQDDNEVDKENVPVSVGSNVPQSRRGRRPLALRDTQKEKEEFLTPSNWLDDHENSAFGRCSLLGGCHSTSEKQNFSKNEKLVRETRSQWRGVAHGGAVTPLLGASSTENGLQKMNYLHPANTS